MTQFAKFVLLTTVIAMAAPGGYHVIKEVKIGGEGGWECDRARSASAEKDAPLLNRSVALHAVAAVRIARSRNRRGGRGASRPPVAPAGTGTVSAPQRERDAGNERIPSPGLIAVPDRGEV